jgi:hypothetical protein
LVHGKKKAEDYRTPFALPFSGFPSFSLTFEDTKRGAQPLKNLLKITPTRTRVFTGNF